jgi:hypothetical protein
LNELSRQYGSRGFHIVAVSDEEAGKIDAYVRNKGVSYGMVKAKNVMQMYGGSGYPSSWLIGPQGNIAWEGHPGGLKATDIEPLLGLVTGATGAPGTGGGVPAAQASGGNWWLWLILFSVVFFAGALGWFWWSSRDKTPNLQAVLYNQQPPQGAPPQGPPGAPPQGAPPQQGAYGAPPQQGGYGAPPQQGGYGSTPQQPVQGAQQQAQGPAPQQGGYLTSEQHTGYSASLGGNQVKGRTPPGVGGANAHGGQEQLVSNTEFRKKPKEVHYLGGDPEEEPPPLQPDQDRQPPKFQPYDPNQHRPR